ncbi:MAG: ester cyclase [Paludibacteraceae bacterium]
MKKAKFVAPLVMAACTIFSANVLTACTTNTNDEAKNVVEAFFCEGYEHHNYEYVMECVSDNYIDHSPVAARSNADAVGILKIVQRQFSDLKITVLDIFSEGDMVATRIRFEGVHADTCQGVPATGRHISFEALENFRVVDGKIVESWGYWPDDDIRRQLSGE